MSAMHVRIKQQKWWTWQIQSVANAGVNGSNSLKSRKNLQANHQLTEKKAKKKVNHLHRQMYEPERTLELNSKDKNKGEEFKKRKSGGEEYNRKSKNELKDNVRNKNFRDSNNSSSNQVHLDSVQIFHLEINRCHSEVEWVFSHKAQTLTMISSATSLGQMIHSSKSSEMVVPSSRHSVECKASNNKGNSHKTFSLETHSLTISQIMECLIRTMSLTSDQTIRMKLVMTSLIISQTS